MLMDDQLKLLYTDNAYPLNPNTTNNKKNRISDIILKWHININQKHTRIFQIKCINYT